MAGTQLFAVLETPGMLADRIRPMVLEANSAPPGRAPVTIAVDRATLTTIWNVLENAAHDLGERRHASVS